VECSTSFVFILKQSTWTSAGVCCDWQAKTYIASNPEQDTPVKQPLINQVIKNMLPSWKSNINNVTMQHVWVTAWLKLNDVSGHVVCLFIWVSEEWVVQTVWVSV
jgi:hypothetical protein